MERLVVEQKEAQKIIEQTNQYRSNYYKYYTGREWLNPTEYDLSINTGIFSEPESAKLIELILRERFPQCFE
jgi:hypothetical protein